MRAHDPELRFEGGGEVAGHGTAARTASRAWWEIALLLGVIAAAALIAVAVLRGTSLIPTGRLEGAPATPAAPTVAPALTPSAPVTAAPTETPVAPEPGGALPELATSDGFLRAALERVVGDRLRFFYTDEMARRWVATVDNLPRNGSLWPLFPMRPAGTPFAVMTGDRGPAIAPANAARYAPYVALLEALPTHAAVAVYLRVYPLLQQEYELLGFPGESFNARLVATLDDLLAAPTSPGAIALVPDRVMYRFADPELEALSGGQKLMLRIGPENAARVKSKVREIRRLIVASTPKENGAAR